MKQYIESIIRRYITTTYYIDGKNEPIVECPYFEYNEYIKTLFIKPSIPTYKMAILKKVIKEYEIPIENIIVGTPMI